MKPVHSASLRLAALATLGLAALGMACTSGTSKEPAGAAGSSQGEKPPEASPPPAEQPGQATREKKPSDQVAKAEPEKPKAEPTGSTRARLRKQPELVCELDMDKTRLEKDYEGAACDAAFSPDGKFLAVGGKFGCIRFFSFDGTTAKYLFRRPEPLPRPRIGAHRALVWVDGDKIAGSGSEHVAFVWDTKNFKLVKAFGTCLNESLHLDWCPKRRLLAMAQKSGVVSVWNYDRKFTRDPAKVFNPSAVDTSINHIQGVKVLAENMAHYCGKALAPGSKDDDAGVQAVAWSPDGMQIVAVGAWGVYVLDASGKVALKQDQMPPIFWKKQQAYIKLVQPPMRDLQVVKRIPIPASDPTGSKASRGQRVHWASNGKYLAVGYGLGRLDANKKANANLPAKVRLFDPATWQLLREWTPHKVRVYAVEFSPDSSVLATGGQKDVYLWDPDTGKKLMTLPPHLDEVTSARWSSDGKFLVTTAGSERIDSNGPENFKWPSKDRKVRIWRVAD